MTKWCMRTACWMLKATITHSQYVLLVAFPLQQWLHECAPMLRYTYTAYFVQVYIEVLLHNSLQLSMNLQPVKRLDITKNNDHDEHQISVDLLKKRNYPRGLALCTYVVSP